MKIIRAFPIVLLLTIAASNVYAHQDTPIELHGKNLIGLPNRFEPAKFVLEERTLQIGKLQLTFPKCVSEYFNSFQKNEIIISASWYHKTTSMPEYISFMLESEEKDVGYALSFDMNTLHPFVFIKIIEHSKGATNLRITIEKQCFIDMTNSIKTI